MRKLALTAMATCVSWVPAAALSAPGGTPGPNPSGGSQVEFTNGFVCPVITTENVLNSPKGISISGGHYSIAGPHPPNVPVHATNQDGAGDPMGEHAVPGDPDYTAIWDVC